MSKFFRETQKAQEGISGEGSAKNLNVGQLLENVKAVERVAAHVVESRLQHCRKIRLTHSSAGLLISQLDKPREAAVEAYWGLRTRLLRLQAAQGLRSVVISSATEREGKTLTAVNLAVSCAQLRDVRTLLVDGDLRTRGLSQVLGYPGSPGLAEVLEGRAQFEEAILSTDIPNLYALGAGEASVSPPELYAGTRWKEFIGWCSECFRIILVDSPPILPLVDFELMAAGCDGVLVVVRALSTQRELLQKATSVLDQKKLLGVVFNDTDNGRAGGYYSGSHRAK